MPEASEVLGAHGGGDPLSSVHVNWRAISMSTNPSSRGPNMLPGRTSPRASAPRRFAAIPESTKATLGAPTARLPRLRGQAGIRLIRKTSSRSARYLCTVPAPLPRGSRPGPGERHCPHGRHRTHGGDAVPPRRSYRRSHLVSHRSLLVRRATARSSPCVPAGSDGAAWRAEGSSRSRHSATLPLAATLTNVLFPHWRAPLISTTLVPESASVTAGPACRGMTVPPIIGWRPGVRVARLPCVSSPEASRR